MFFSQNPFCLWDPVIATRAFTILLCSSMFCDSSLPWIEGAYMYVILKTGQNTNNVHPLLFILVLYCFSSSLPTQGTLHHCDMTSHLHRHTQIFQHTHTTHSHTRTQTHSHTFTQSHIYMYTKSNTLFHSSTHPNTETCHMCTVYHSSPSLSLYTENCLLFPSALHTYIHTHINTKTLPIHTLPCMQPCKHAQTHTHK